MNTFSRYFLSEPALQATFTFGTTTIPYTLMRSPTLKAIKISVEFEYGVEVVAPAGMDLSQIDAALRKKATWIIEKLKVLDEVATRPPTREWVSGEKLPLLGQHYTLVVEERAERKPFAVGRGKKIVVTVPPSLPIWQRRERVRETLIAWYQRQADERLPARVKHYTDKLNLRPARVEIVDLDRRWGSCTPTGAVRLNWRLVMAGVPIIDYVVVHELCHLQVGDHSTAFWELLRSILSDYETRREWLRVNGPTLSL